MKYKIESVGCELEYGDLDTKIQLPKGLTWDYKDYSICNSNGTANDPKKKLQRYGSEIHTTPIKEISDLLFLILHFQESSRIHFNFTTNLHIHIGVPGLRNDLDALKKLEMYYHKNAAEMFYLIQPIPKPMQKDYKNQKAFEGAWRRYKRRKRSHQHQVDANTFDRLMNAKTCEDFNQAFYSHDKNGRAQMHLFQREGVNLAHLWKPTQTIEFRHFTMTRDKNRLYSALLWPRLYLQAALETDEKPSGIIRRHKKLEFQPFYKYDYKKDRIFQMTNLSGKSYAAIKRAYERLVEKGILHEEDYIR